MLQAKNKPNLRVVSSVEFQGYRVRALWSTVFIRPLAETFHEFLIHVLILTFGETWFNEQRSTVQKHIVIQWLIAWEQWRQSSQIPSNKITSTELELWNALPSGEVKALAQLAYDLFCLQAVNKLPNFMIQKLRDMHEFQGVRYEIAVAAIIARANFEITFLDEVLKTEKHCEFTAMHNEMKFEVGVEAKSRRRPGILHQTGTFDPAKNAKADISKLFHKALKQKPDALPFLIFIDLNLPPLHTPIFKDVSHTLDKHNHCSPASPDDYNALFLTNFAHYYLGSKEVDKGAHTATAFLPQYTQIHCDQRVLADIWDSVRNYENIPLQI